jgi:hypothetical protein
MTRTRLERFHQALQCDFRSHATRSSLLTTGPTMSRRLPRMTLRDKHCSLWRVLSLPRHCRILIHRHTYTRRLLRLRHHRPVARHWPRVVQPTRHRARTFTCPPRPQNWERRHLRPCQYGRRLSPYIPTNDSAGATTKVIRRHGCPPSPHHGLQTDRPLRPRGSPSPKLHPRLSRDPARPPTLGGLSLPLPSPAVARTHLGALLGTLLGAVDYLLPLPIR